MWYFNMDYGLPFYIRFIPDDVDSKIQMDTNTNGPVQANTDHKRTILTLHGVSMINLPSFEIQGIVPCWKKVTCIQKIISYFRSFCP